MKVPCGYRFVVWFNLAAGAFCALVGAARRDVTLFWLGVSCMSTAAWIWLYARLRVQHDDLRRAVDQHLKARGLK